MMAKNPLISKAWNQRMKAFQILSYYRKDGRANWFKWNEDILRWKYGWREINVDRKREGEINNNNNKWVRVAESSREIVRRIKKKGERVRGRRS
jgi:hypothetical protein